MPASIRGSGRASRVCSQALLAASMAATVGAQCQACVSQGACHQDQIAGSGAVAAQGHAPGYAAEDLHGHAQGAAGGLHRHPGDAKALRQRRAKAFLEGSEPAAAFRLAIPGVGQARLRGPGSCAHGSQIAQVHRQGLEAHVPRRGCGGEVHPMDQGVDGDHQLLPGIPVERLQRPGDAGGGVDSVRNGGHLCYN